MFLLVRVVVVAPGVEDPRPFPADAVVVRVGGVVPRGPGAARAGDGLADVAGATLDLPAHAQAADAVGVFVLHREVVVDVTELRPGPRLPAAHAHALDRVRLQGPVDHVQVVDVLLANVVARQPAEIQPVADLPFHVGHLRRAVGVPQRPLVPVAAGRGDGADLAAVDAAQRLEIAGLVVPLQPRDDAQAAAVGFVVQGQHRAHAGGVHGDGLLGEDVLVGVDRRLQVDRPEAGRRGQDHQVAVGDDPLIGVQADELPFGRHVHEVADVGAVRVAELVQGVVDPVAYRVADGPELDVLAAVDALDSGALAAAAAADQADADDVVGAGVDGGGRRQRRGAAGDGGGLQEVTTSGHAETPVNYPGFRGSLST